MSRESAPRSSTKEDSFFTYKSCINIVHVTYIFHTNLPHER
ncbi:Uncharacterised protein [Vibrio cholerae]|nr:Uncharacterised protein [Vibrio cholerae]